MKRSEELLSGLSRAVRRGTSEASVHRLRKVYVEPTTRCNLHCPTCMRRSWDEPAADMTMAIYGRLLEDLRRIGTVRSVAYWGIGEPLVHPHLVEMIGSAHTLGLETELITNAQLLDACVARGLVEAGLDRIVVSVDGTSTAALSRIRPGAELETTKENVRLLRQARRERGVSTPEIAVEFVLMRSNLDQLRDLPSLARELDASTVYLTNVLPYSGDFADEILYELSAASKLFSLCFKRTGCFVLPRLDFRREIREAIAMLPIDTPRGFLHPLIWPINDGSKCPFVERGAVAVRSDGAVSPCVELLHSHRVYVVGREKQVRRYELGRLERETLAEIWGGEEYRAFRERVSKFDFPPCLECGRCDMAESNEEDCFGRPFPTCGDCLWARGVVLCP